MRRCVKVVLTEEAEHHRYAARDLARLEAGTRAPTRRLPDALGALLSASRRGPAGLRGPRRRHRKTLFHPLAQSWTGQDLLGQHGGEGRVSPVRRGWTTASRWRVAVPATGHRRKAVPIAAATAAATRAGRSAAEAVGMTLDGGGVSPTAGWATGSGRRGGGSTTAWQRCRRARRPGSCSRRPGTPARPPRTPQGERRVDGPPARGPGRPAEPAGSRRRRCHRPCCGRQADRLAGWCAPIRPALLKPDRSGGSCSPSSRPSRRKDCTAVGRLSSCRVVELLCP